MFVYFTSFSIHERNYLYKFPSNWLLNMPWRFCWSSTWLYVRLAKLKLLVSRRAHSSHVLSTRDGWDVPWMTDIFWDSIPGPTFTVLNDCGFMRFKYAQWAICNWVLWPKPLLLGVKQDACSSKPRHLFPSTCKMIASLGSKWYPKPSIRFTKAHPWFAHCRLLQLLQVQRARAQMEKGRHQKSVHNSKSLIYIITDNYQKSRYSAIL